MKRSKIFFGALFGLLISSQSVAEMIDPAIRGYLQRSLTQSEEVRSLYVQLEAEKKRLRASLPVWDIVLNTQVTERQTDGDSNTSKGAQASAVIPESASELRLSYQNNAITSLFTDVAALQFNQRVWNNGFGSNHQLEKDRLALEYQLAVLDTGEKLEQVILTGSLEFLELFAIQRRMQVLGAMLRDARQLEDNIERRYRSGISLEADYLQTQVSRQQLEVQLQNLGDQFKRTKTILETRLDIRVELPQMLRVDVNLADKKPFAHLRPLRIAQLRQKIFESRAALLQEEQRLTIDALLGVENRQLRNSSSSQEYYFFGVEAELPVRDRQRSFALAEGKLRAENQKLQVSLQRKNLLEEQLGLQADLRSLQARLSLQKNMLRSLEKISRLEKKRYDNGLISLREVLSARRAADDLRLTILDAEIEQQQLGMQWLALHDQLLEQVSLASLSTSISEATGDRVDGDE